MDPGHPRSELSLLSSKNTTFESEKRWFFNPITESCVQFDYLGSEGNANNFVTKLQCETYCGNSNF